MGFLLQSFACLLATFLLSDHLWQTAALLTCLGCCFVSAGLFQFLFNMRWWNRCQNFPSFTALNLLKGKLLTFLSNVNRCCLNGLNLCADTVTPHLFVSCGQRLDRLHQRAPVKPARGRGYDGGRWLLHSECCLGSHSPENSRFIRKIFLGFTIKLNWKEPQNIIIGFFFLLLLMINESASVNRLIFGYRVKKLIYKPASSLMAVPLPLRCTLSTGGPVPASPRPSRSSPKKSWATEPSRPSLQMPPPLLLRGSLAGVGEIRQCPAPLPPQTGLGSDQHPSAALEEKKTTTWSILLFTTENRWI